MFGMTLIENWKSAWRWFSVQALGALVLLPIVWASIPDDVKHLMPLGWGKWVFFIIAAAGLIGRFVDQKKA